MVVPLTAHIRFVYDGYKLLEELNGLNGNAVLRRYVWQPVMLDISLSVFDAAANKTYFYLTDANKNVTDVIDSTNVVLAHYEYMPFGKFAKNAGSYANINPFRFSSEYYDDSTQLIYFNYRYYDPLLGRWVSRDPLHEQGGLNLYNMCKNNPIQYWDYLGYFGDGIQILRPGRRTSTGDPVPPSADIAGPVYDSIFPGIPLGHSDFEGGDYFAYTRLDHDPNTSPYNPLSVGLHFMRAEEALKLVDTARKECDKEAFGDAMHSLQDSFSHYNSGYRSWGNWRQLNPLKWLPGHLGGWTYPDADMRAWNAANEETKIQIEKWKKECPYPENIGSCKLGK